MYHLVLDGTPRIDVISKDKKVSYATDRSLPDPLEATYFALSGCAGVYAAKACKALGISDEGIAIRLRPMVRPSNPSLPTRITIAVTFPARFDREQRDAILDSIGKCTVKELIRNGGGIEFEVKSQDAGPADAGG